MIEQQEIRLEAEASKLDFLVEALNFGELCLGGNEIGGFGLQGILKDIVGNIRVLIKESEKPESDDELTGFEEKECLAT